MVISPNVTLESATANDHPLLENLFELYLHDMSEIFPIKIGADGRFGYEDLPLYASRPDTHLSYLVRVETEVAGFVLSTRGSQLTNCPEDLDVAHFFVLRSLRRHGVGHSAAHLLWNRMPGRWIVRVSQMNRAGLQFWDGVIRGYTLGAFDLTDYRGKHHMFRAFSFQSRSCDTEPAALRDSLGGSR